MAQRTTLFFLLICFMILGSCLIAAAQTGGTGCTRESLKGIVEQYFTSIETHSTAKLPLASTVKFTENGTEVAVGKGFFETGGKALLKRSALDTTNCGTATQAIIEENGRPIIFGARLKVSAGKITEIETLLAREKEFAFTPKGVLDTKDQDWESILPVGKRTSRLAMTAAAYDYFDMFADEAPVHVPFNIPCDRWENGMQTTAGGAKPHECTPEGLKLNMKHPPRRIPIVDVEAGIAVAFVQFGGTLPDFHMFKIVSGKVMFIQAVIGAGGAKPFWPVDPIGQ
jgi:hypothetical protein